MANTRSAKKSVRQSARRTEINKSRLSRVRNFVRKVEEEISDGDQCAASAALKAAQTEIMIVAQNGLKHKNAASRKISRLSSRIKAIGA